MTTTPTTRSIDDALLRRLDRLERLLKPFVDAETARKVAA
jgi:hypothetical protein